MENKKKKNGPPGMPPANMGAKKTIAALEKIEREGFTWRNPPAPVDEASIACELTADVVVIGAGHAGTPAARAAAEAGASVILMEKLTEKNYMALGQDFGHINSKFLASRNVPRVDPIELFNEMMRRGGNRANPSLVMQFARHCGEAFDWFVEPCPPERIEEVIVTYNPTGPNFKGDLSGQKFWTGTAEFPGWFRRGLYTITDAHRCNQERARQLGAQLLFSTEAQYLEKDCVRVSAVIAKRADGSYIRCRANKGIILAAGDFAANTEMCIDLLPDLLDIIDIDNDEGFAAMGGRDGRGIQMGVWAGGRLEARPIPTMGGNYATLMGAVSNFGSLWLDGNGRRYCNESFGDPVFAGFPGAQEKHSARYLIYDSGVLEDLSHGPPAHTSFDYNSEEARLRLRDTMQKAVEAGDEGFCERGAVFAADDFETLGRRVGLDGEKLSSFVASIERYNELCRLGRDEDFGKDPDLMNAFDEPPYFAEVVDDFHIGSMMVTVGGLLTNERQNVLDKNRDPIPGLYATGNCCGRRFGTQYSTPIAGVSIGMAVTLGRICGENAAKG